MHSTFTYEHPPAAEAGRARGRDAAARFSRRLEDHRRRLDAELSGWIASRRRELEETGGAEAAVLAAAVARLVEGGGKRLRPALVELAYEACGGRAEEAVRRLGMAVELLHTYLLIHDDIMDHAALRRGVPTAHASFAELHRERGWAGDPEEYGRSVAILAGDLAHSWAAELSRLAPGAGPEGDTGAVARCFDAMSQEVIGGQLLEMTLPLRHAAADTADRAPEEEDLLRALRLKSGRYTVERPLELGARLAGAEAELIRGLRRYGAAVGEAFQLQDDVLGTFGEPGAVGKPVASDLEEGKHTFLVHHALEDAPAADRSWLRRALRGGLVEPSRVERAREILRESGALGKVEEMIRERLERGREALAALPFSGEHRALFDGLVDYLERRDR